MICYNSKTVIVWVGGWGNKASLATIRFKKHTAHSWVYVGQQFFSCLVVPSSFSQFWPLQTQLLDPCSWRSFRHTSSRPISPKIACPSCPTRDPPQWPSPISFGLLHNQFTINVIVVVFPFSGANQQQLVLKHSFRSETCEQWNRPLLLSIILLELCKLHI